MRKIADPADDWVYTERISSNKTEGLFLALMTLSFLLLIWRMNDGSIDILGIVFACFFFLFIFYSANYRTLVIRLTFRALKLTFGMISWTVQFNNVESISIDEIPPLMRMGGAGIHFMLIHNRYRASFNFLEYPRVVIAFKKKVGPVQDISFSTRQPEVIIDLVQHAVTEDTAI